MCALVHPIRFDPQYRVRYWVFSEPLRQEGGRPQGGWVVGPRSNSTLLRVFDISLSLSLSLSRCCCCCCCCRERVVPNHSIFSLSVSLCVCVCVLPSMSSSILAPSLKLLPQTLHSAPPRLPPLSRSVCFGLFCVVCFRSMSLPRFGNLWIFPSYHLGRRTGHQGESRRAQDTGGGGRGPGKSSSAHHHGVFGEDAGKACARWKQNQWCQQGHRMGTTISGKKKQQQTTLSGHTHHKNN